uniref:Uncharacterized protein n=1 Tax=Gallus gallus TaxID=9031 RepID=A0A8V0Z765_CHICK
MKKQNSITNPTNTDSNSAVLPRGQGGPRDAPREPHCPGLGPVSFHRGAAQVEALTVPVLHSVDHLLRHTHGEGEVAAHLPHHDGGANVLGLDLDVLARHLLGDLQAVGSVLVAAVLGAISKGSRELVHLCLVHFLLHAFLEALEDDGELRDEKDQKERGYKMTT